MHETSVTDICPLPGVSTIDIGSHMRRTESQKSHFFFQATWKSFLEIASSPVGNEVMQLSYNPYSQSQYTKVGIITLVGNLRFPGICGLGPVVPGLWSILRMRRRRVDLEICLCLLLLLRLSTRNGSLRFGFFLSSPLPESLSLPPPLATRGEPVDL